ncbi:MAG TPA: Eco57I restriction-modification methylase domain-containing protein, partial [Bacteroidales bacterium]|nr:Eco57I restriction-modification methylase domain-containing protein [Bacteroidales bacterium]
GKADFSTIELLKEAFSVEPVTKQFYNEIQSWYFWAMDKIKFPTDYKYSDNPEKDDEIRNSNNLIRLITRVIFIWFIKQKNLINDELFSEDKLKNILKDFNKNNESANYYNAILQNLFFATLNQKMNERKFAENNGFQENKKEYGVKNLYRYDDLFQISKEDILQLFNMTPFLNGGLFDCLDKENENGKVIYIDGFSRNPQKKAIIPDFLFFQKNETKVNLSKYGLSKDSPIKGLIKILQEYNFTIDENTPIDQEVALDPELLGKVFENLLASYNPETATTARKATGSYYTPREIVDYMVQESLFNYLIDKCPNIDQSKLKELLSYSENSIDLTDTERDDIIAALDNIKILDPACGSGAFPMGALHKIVYALQKLDPDNSRWKNLQIDKVNKETNVIFHQTDKNEREARLKELNEMFDESINYPDYTRKLFIIENCIYGVDIQTIAIQISKLRFFISLVLDQKVDNTKENMGIRALPNMETKFVAANTLIGLEIPEKQLLFQDKEIIEIQNKLAEIRHKYFSTKTRREKLEYQEQDKEYRKKLADHVKNYLIEINKDEIYQIKNKIEELKLILQDVIKGPEKIIELEQTTIFGDIEKIKINTNKNKINEIRYEIKNYEDKLKILQEQMNTEYIIKITDKIAKFDIYDPNASADWFDPEWMFGVDDGFDAVIGNPPYIGEKGHKEIFKNVKNVDLGKFYVGKMDYFYFFFHLALNIAKDNGYIAFITTNYYITALGAKKLREDLYKRATIIKLINFNELKIFESATGQHNMITILKKGKKDNEFTNTIITHKKGHATSEILQKILSGDDNETDYYQMKQKDLYDDDEYYIRLIPKSDESIQKILDKIKNTGTKLGNICNVNQGIVTGADKVSKKHIEEYNINANINDGIFVLSNSEINTLNLTENEKKILKPWFKNSDILRWITFFNSNDNLLFLSKDLNEKYLQQYYPNIYIHIYKYKNIMISKRKNLNERLDKWFTLNRGTAHPNIFISPKIVAPQRSPKNTFGYNEVPWYASADVYFITQKDENVSLKYILALLNSKLYYLWLYYRGKRKGEFLELYQKPLSEIPIKIVPQMDQQPFIDLVDQILDAKKTNHAADTT